MGNPSKDLSEFVERSKDHSRQTSEPEIRSPESRKDRGKKDRNGRTPHAVA